MTAATLVDPAQRWTLPPPLAERLDCFARWPSRYLHEDRQNQADREALTRLDQFGPSAAVFWHREKSATLCAELGLDRLPLPPLSQPLARVVLLDAKELTALAGLCGTTLQTPWIRSAIGRDEVAQWRDVLGDALYTFAVHHAHRFHPIARMTPQRVAEHFAATMASIAAPPANAAQARIDVPAAGMATPTAPMALSASMSEGLASGSPLLSVRSAPPMRQAIDAIGWRVLASLASRTPDAVACRLALKLPADALASVVQDRIPDSTPRAADASRAAPPRLPDTLPAAPALAGLADTDLLTFVASLTTCLDAPWLSTFDTLP